MPICIGMNARQFPGNWRPAAVEIAFASGAGFASLQFQGEERGLDETRLGAPPEEVGRALAAVGIEAVMEIVVRVDAAGRTASGLTPLAVLERNLPAIVALPCTRVHWHLVPRTPLDDAACVALETALLPQFAAGVERAAVHGFRFGFEHNEPALGLCTTPARCAAILDAVPGLGFV